MADKIRAWIIIQSGNKRYKYVRDVVADNGLNAEHYQYGDTIGDSFGAQTGTGKVKGDYDALITNYIAASGSRDFLLFPESAGDTHLLIRKNKGLPDEDNEYGDSDITPYIYTKISANSVQAIYVEEIRITNWEMNGNVQIP